MATSKVQCLALVALTIFSPSLQVTITLEWWLRGHLGSIRGDYVGKCIDIPPGDCCKPHRDLLAPPDEIGSSVVGFGTLFPGQYGAGWGSSGPDYEDILDCTGVPILRVFGPELVAIYQLPDYPMVPDVSISPDPPDHSTAGIASETSSIDSEDTASGEPYEIVFAATWIDLRTRFPPDSAGTRYLRFQGVKSLIWGENTWSAASDGIPFPKRKRGANFNQWAPRGEAVIHTPRRWRHPSSYTINGTEFTNGGNGVYRSQEGAVLKLTDNPYNRLDGGT
ncbi:MAG: hypothetical protein L6R42_006489 [Xanthoria sp. 1 TBL-2021]|nr:MAG: hypothetical protein L6R42_006489 [Xanthoria sp. 1 TBL-2021]